MSKAETAATEDDGKVGLKVNRDRYQPVRSASGSKSLNNGDEVATAVAGFDIDQMYATAKKFLKEDFKERYAKLNIGMQRMNLGNRIRGAVAKIDAANEKLVAAKEQPNEPGIVQLTAITDPVQEKNAKRVAKEDADKAKKAQATADAKAKKEAAKPKKKVTDSKKAA